MTPPDFKEVASSRTSCQISQGFCGGEVGRPGFRGARQNSLPHGHIHTCWGLYTLHHSVCWSCVSDIIQPEYHISSFPWLCTLYKVLTCTGSIIPLIVRDAEIKLQVPGVLKYSSSLLRSEVECCGGDDDIPLHIHLPANLSLHSLGAWPILLLLLLSSIILHINESGGNDISLVRMAGHVTSYHMVLPSQPSSSS